MTDVLTNSVASHPPATDTAAAPSSVPTDGRSAPFHIPDEVVICLPMPPTTNNLFAGTGKHRYRTDEYNSWIEDAGWQLATQRPPQVIGKVSLLIEVEEPKTAVRQDVSNRTKATEDLLVRHKIIEGDDQFHVREVVTRWVSGVEGVRVTIRPLASENGVAG